MLIVSKDRDFYDHIGGSNHADKIVYNRNPRVLDFNSNEYEQISQLIMPLYLEAPRIIPIDCRQTSKRMDFNNAIDIKPIIISIGGNLILFYYIDSYLFSRYRYFYDANDFQSVVCKEIQHKRDQISQVFGTPKLVNDEGNECSLRKIGRDKVDRLNAEIKLLEGAYNFVRSGRIPINLRDKLFYKRLNSKRLQSYIRPYELFADYNTKRIEHLYNLTKQNNFGEMNTIGQTMCDIVSSPIVAFGYAGIVEKDKQLCAELLEGLGRKHVFAAVDINLDKFDFTRFAPGFSVNMVVERWLSMRGNNNNTEEVSNQTKIEKHGFDERSFRSVSPGKKHRRRNKKK